MLAKLAPTDYVWPEEYLAEEELATEKHEYLNGFVYPCNMAGAGDAHVKISLNAAALIKTHLRGSGCSTYISDMRVKVNAKDKAWFYPDVMVTCDPDDHERNTIKHNPMLVVEVMSPSTRDYDRGDKFVVYRQLANLREYVLIDPNEYAVDVFRLNAHQRWELFTYNGADTVAELTSIGFQCALQDLYEDVGL
ncbi:MAG TPA: Uma2 family endonuclease [Candidatus Thiothrix moscowensis]|uniref:Uma2 family endonuclease n=1 Tax=unclassified Thiothrix TaxID=2636184 RepID=UPI0025D89A08|nr:MULTISPECIES: Uma2 family endonuclease [unclassified Thiothrix]HRJ52159.1 Uma2 family endonuclease [Candidatus Thiothrix moscowensis]HRJ92330.1 Uma2 family endonuclease [Candidatus Thiothrix moscowensis]